MFPGGLGFGEWDFLGLGSCPLPSQTTTLDHNLYIWNNIIQTNQITGYKSTEIKMLNLRGRLKTPNKHRIKSGQHSIWHIKFNLLLEIWPQFIDLGIIGLSTKDARISLDSISPSSIAFLE